MFSFRSTLHLFSTPLTHNVISQRGRERINEQIEVLKSMLPPDQEARTKAQVLEQTIAYVSTLVSLIVLVESTPFSKTLTRFTTSTPLFVKRTFALLECTSSYAKKM